VSAAAKARLRQKQSLLEKERTWCVALCLGTVTLLYSPTVVRADPMDPREFILVASQKPELKAVTTAAPKVATATVPKVATAAAPKVATAAAPKAVSAATGAAHAMRVDRLAILVSERDKITASHAAALAAGDKAALNRAQVDLEAISREIAMVSKQPVIPTTLAPPASAGKKPAIVVETATPESQQSDPQSYESWDIFKNFDRNKGPNHEPIS